MLRKNLVLRFAGAKQTIYDVVTSFEGLGRSNHERKEPKRRVDRRTCAQLACQRIEQGEILHD